MKNNDELLLFLNSSNFVYPGNLFKQLKGMTVILDGNRCYLVDKDKKRAYVHNMTGQYLSPEYNGWTSVKYSSMKQSMEVLTSSKSNEWYTPKWIIDKVIRVFGEKIDLDPASCEKANETVRANYFWTIDDDCLRKQWHAKTVWLNPPRSVKGGKSMQSIMIEHMHDQWLNGRFSQGMAVIRTVPGYKWYNKAIALPAAYCVTYDRVRFIDADTMQEGGQDKMASTFLYWGNRSDVFDAIFSEIGQVTLLLF